MGVFVKCLTCDLIKGHIANNYLLVYWSAKEKSIAIASCIMIAPELLGTRVCKEY